MRRVTDAAELDGLSRDAGPATMVPKVAYFASTESEVVAAIREAEAAGLPVTPRGGGTGIPTQSVGRGALVIQTDSTAALSGELVTCGPGLVKADLNRYLVQGDRWLPVDPSSYASCTVGGMVANNSSGARSLKYGSTIEYVSGLRVALPGGDAFTAAALPLGDAGSGDQKRQRAVALLTENQKAIAEEAPRVTKNSSGYRLERVVHDGVLDFPRLFVGSEGTLGVTTQATLRVVKRPSWRALFVVDTSLAALDHDVGAFRSLRPAALELVDKSVFRRVGRWDRVAPYSRSDDQYMLFCELDGEGSQGEAMERAGSSQVAGLEPMALSDPADVQSAWEVRNETLSLALEIRDGPRSLAPGVEDLVVPPDKLGELVRLLTGQFESRGLGYILYGHAGDANLHARPLVDGSGQEGKGTMRELMDECFERVWKMGGSMTGEHGDGMLRAGYVERQYPRTYWIMKEIKAIFDPKMVMNPGVKLA